MNFGGFATPERNILFDINDFDETLPAPWEWDLNGARFGARFFPLFLAWGNKFVTWELIRRGNPHVAIVPRCLCAAVVANVIAVVAIAAALKRDLTRFWRLWCKF